MSGKLELVTSMPSDGSAAEYDDEYPTCKETYATLRIFSDQLSPTVISEALGILPSHSFVKGEESWPGVFKKTNGWFMSSKAIEDSRDSRRHLDWIVSRYVAHRKQFVDLRSQNISIDIVCYWVSAVGDGGPCLGHAQMTTLGMLELDIWWDIYFAKNSEL